MNSKQTEKVQQSSLTLNVLRTVLPFAIVHMFCASLNSPRKSDP